jgi:hypothetical protein
MLQQRGQGNHSPGRGIKAPCGAVRAQLRVSRRRLNNFTFYFIAFSYVMQWNAFVLPGIPNLTTDLYSFFNALALLPIAVLFGFAYN